MICSPSVLSTISFSESHRCSRRFSHYWKKGSGWFCFHFTQVCGLKRVYYLCSPLSFSLSLSLSLHLSTFLSVVCSTRSLLISIDAQLDRKVLYPRGSKEATEVRRGLDGFVREGWWHLCSSIDAPSSERDTRREPSFVVPAAAAVAASSLTNKRALSREGEFVTRHSRKFSFPVVRNRYVQAGGS